MMVHGSRRRLLRTIGPGPSLHRQHHALHEAVQFTFAPLREEPETWRGPVIWALRAFAFPLEEVGGLPRPRLPLTAEPCTYDTA
jgi:hypothetical protein